jgi:ubiquinone/menaquinone biosynthesis C-methylase UbiE
MNGITKWPKLFPELTAEQKWISNDFMHYWHTVIPKKYKIIENFNHNYVVHNAPAQFINTLEIGAGLGEHIFYEKLTSEQRANYVALELRENMAEEIKNRHPDIKVLVGDCQQTISAPSYEFDRVVAIHVLEHLPNLPQAIKEIYRVCHKSQSVFSVVIPCEGGLLYSLARKISAQRIFEKRYKQPYQWFIEREHVNKPEEILEELLSYFTLKSRQFFPFLFLPFIWCNLFIGLTFTPKIN